MRRVDVASIRHNPHDGARHSNFGGLKDGVRVNQRNPTVDIKATLFFI